MRQQITLGLLCAGVALVGIALMVACNTESATENNVVITPANVRLAKGQSQQFTASGGYDYTWSLEGGTIIDEWGLLSASRGPTTVYTSTKDASTSGTFRVIHVVSTISGSGASAGATTGTNLPTSTTTTYAMAAEAYVEHAVAYSTLNVSPVAVTGFKYGSFQVFTASGGNGVYSWNLEHNLFGTLSPATGPNTTYTSTRRALDDNTINMVHCLSGDGQVINIPVFHANEAVTNPVTALAISPANATVSLDGSQTFTASGGDGAYLFDLSTTAYGRLSMASSDAATYLCTSVDATNTVVVRLTVRSNGETREATILHTPSGAIEGLRITPASVPNFSQGSSVAFTASGGSGGYDWTLYPPNPAGLGILTVSSETSATYTSTTNVGTNPPLPVVTITVVDSDGTIREATVTHRN